MQLTRRYFLKSSGALAVYCGVSPLRALAEANISGTTEPPPIAVRPHQVLVAIFLRGGTDGLNFIVPFGDPDYAARRRSIAIPRPGAEGGALDLDGFFGLHPAAASLSPLFSDGTFRALHAVGYDHNTRSHFEEQDVWETGVIGNTLNSDGWLNRHLQTSTGSGIVRAISLGDSLPRILHGKAPSYAIRGLADLALPDMRESNTRVRAALEHAYRHAAPDMLADGEELVRNTGALTLEGIRELEKITAAPYAPAATYPKSAFAKHLEEAARLIKSNIGIEVIEVELGGWDTHNRQGGAQGDFANNVRTLSEAIAAFCQDLGPHLDQTLILTMSDFGRTASENGTGGTDHGWGNCLMLGGGPIRARALPKPVIADWPGLAPESLYQKRDLLHTIDFRDVLAEVVSHHLGNPHLAKVLPAHTFKSLGILAPPAV